MTGEKTIAALVVVAVAAAGEACAPSTEGQQLLRLEQALNSLRAQQARDSSRVEELAHEVLLLSERQALPAAAEPATAVPHHLKIVRLNPPPTKDVEPKSDQPVVLSLPDEPGSEVLSVRNVPPAPAADRADQAQQLLQQGLAAFQNGDFAEAARHFESFVAKFNHHVDADKATYWLGECRLEQEKYNLAVDAFTTVLTQFPRSSKRADALLKAGIAFERLQKPADARRMFTELVDAFPRTALADLARARLAPGQKGVAP